MIRRTFPFAALLYLVVWVSSSPLVAQAPNAKLEQLEEQAFKQAAALVSPSIVQIQTIGGLDRVGRVLTGTGPTTGLAVSKDGYIISSAFNFIGKPASVLVNLPDGRRFPAKVVATDRSKMLTLIKIETSDLLPAQAATKKSFRVGQWTIAMGRTFESPEPNVSVGIVSALNRIWGKAIQTDAKVSPMNYGGPLVDIEGRVMGVLVPLSPRRSGETAGIEWYDSGIGFAVPLEDIYASLDRLKSGTDLKPGLMGITFKGGDIYGAKPAIDRVRYNSPAQKAGLKSGDVFEEVDGKKIIRQAQVRHALGNKYAGDTISVAVRRGDKVIRQKIKLVAELEAYESAFLGILPIRERSDGEAATGVGVRYVYANSPAEKAGLQSFDRIIRFNDAEVTDAASLTDLVSRRRPKDKMTLVYVRNEKETKVEVELTSIPNSVPEELRSAAIAPAEADDEAKDAPKTGRFTEKMPAHDHSYWAYVPEDYNPDDQYGLMVWIHPGGDTMEAELYQEWKLICDLRGIIILSPKAKKVSGWNPSEAGFVKDAVEQIQKKYSIDKSRVFLHGFSDGARFAYHLAFKYRELFRGLAVAAEPLKSPAPENKPEFRLQFHFLCGDKDNLYSQVSRTVTNLRRMKFPASFTTINEYTHKYPPPLDVEEIGRWVDALDRI